MTVSLARRLPQIAAHGIFEFVGNSGYSKSGAVSLRRTAFKRDDGQAGIGQCLGHDGAGPAITDDDGIGGLFPSPSALAPLMATGP